MNNHANYQFVEDNPVCLCIEDIGPWDQHPTVTNDVEHVVAELAPRLRGRRLEYIDSENSRDILLVKDGKFAGFAPGGYHKN